MVTGDEEEEDESNRKDSLDPRRAPLEPRLAPSNLIGFLQ
jgi:hypothetical protein